MPYINLNWNLSPFDPAHSMTKHLRIVRILKQVLPLENCFRQFGVTDRGIWGQRRNVSKFRGEQRRSSAVGGAATAEYGKNKEEWNRCRGWR